MLKVLTGCRESLAEEADDEKNFKEVHPHEHPNFPLLMVDFMLNRNHYEDEEHDLDDYEDGHHMGVRKCPQD